MSAFLIRHGSYAIGTKFGPAETDLVTGTVADPLVVEVKLFPTTPPSPSEIEHYATQLLSYMDQAPIRSRGALLLVNFSSTLITAPREFIRSRLAIVAVNLIDASPSKRKGSLCIEPNPDPARLLHVYTVGSLPGSVPAVPTKKPTGAPSSVKKTSKKSQKKKGPGAHSSGPKEQGS